MILSISHVNINDVITCIELIYGSLIKHQLMSNALNSYLVVSLGSVARDHNILSPTLVESYMQAIISTGTSQKVMGLSSNMSALMKDSEYSLEIPITNNMSSIVSKCDAVKKKQLESIWNDFYVNLKMLPIKPTSLLRYENIPHSNCV